MINTTSDAKHFLLYLQPSAAGGLDSYASSWFSVLRERGNLCTVVSNPLGLKLAGVGKNRGLVFISLNRFTIASRMGLPSSLRNFLRRALLFVSPIFFVVNLFNQYRLLSKTQPSACIAFNGGYPADESCLSLIIAARLAKVPAALVVLGTPRRRRRVLYAYDLLLDKFLGSAKILVTNANHISQNLRRHRGVGTRPIMKIYNPVPSRGPKKSHDTSPSGGSKLVVVSRLDLGKGLPTLLTAVSILDKEQVAELHIIGSGVLRANLESLANVLDVADRVTFHGQLSELEKGKIINSSNIAVLPSDQEGLSFSLLEAMASGVPLVCSAIPGNLEIITHGREALTFPVGKPAELARMISMIHDDQDLGRKLAKKAKTQVEFIGSEARFGRNVEEAVRIMLA